MASTTLGFSYRRLRNEGGEFDERDYDEEIERAIDHVRARSWSKRLKRVHVKKRLKIMKISRLKRFLKRKVRLVSVSWMKVVKRLKESQSHFGDLFAGNYLFMQVSPTPLKSCAAQKSVKAIVDRHHHGLSSGYSASRVS